MPQAPAKPSFADAYRMKSSAKRFARGGQIGLSDRKARLKEMLFNESVPVEALETEDPIEFSLEEDVPVDEKPSRKDRIREILNENRIESLKKTDI